MNVASAARRPVFAHAIGQAGALLAASHGVRALAHTPIVDSAGAATLARSGITVISTLASLGPRPGGEEVRQSMRLLHAAGVPVVAGTDAGVLAHGQNAGELIALTEVGFTPADALRAATVRAAALLKTPGIGEIKVGGQPTSSWFRATRWRTFT
jgi:imidazolonepropionase-like amidohydrolase